MQLRLCARCSWPETPARLSTFETICRLPLLRWPHHLSPQWWWSSQGSPSQSTSNMGWSWSEFSMGGCCMDAAQNCFSCTNSVGVLTR